MRNALFLILFLTVQVVSAQEFSVRKGVVVDSLKVSDTLNESYALYVPTSFQGQRPWPLLMIFDPEGRGRIAANLFRHTAEKQGYILVSSNDISSEKELLDNVHIGTRLLSHVTQVLPVDLRQISTAGSLDGAQVATTIPVIFDNIFGVLAVGDQWVNIDLLDRKKKFTFIGVVGDEQFTSTGMDLTSEALENFDVFTAVYKYEGDKEWPQPDLLNSAVGSLTLQAMRKKLRPLDPAVVQELYQADLARVNQMISIGKLIEAFEFMDLLEDKYKGFTSLAEVEQKQDQLKRSRNYLQQKRELEQVLRKENRLANDFIYYFAEDVRNSNFENLGWWNYQKVRLDSLVEVGGAEGKMAGRLKGLVSEMAKRKRTELQKERTPLEVELFTNMLQTIFDPTNYKAYRRIITLSAQDNDFPTALFYLEEMLKHGYRNKEALYNIEGTLGLRLTPEFNRIVESYLGSSKFYDEQK